MGSRIYRRVTDQKRRDLQKLSPAEFVRKYGYKLTQVHALRQYYGFARRQIRRQLRGQKGRDLEKLSPAEFARKYGLELSKVHYLRHYHGFLGNRSCIKKFSDTKSKEYHDLLYLKPREVAEKYKLNIYTVYGINEKMGIKKFRVRWIDRLRMTPRLLRDLEELSLKAFGSKYGISMTNIYQLRRKYHLIRAPFLKSLTSREKRQLKRMTLDEAALKFRVCTRTIVRARHKLGVYGHAPRKKR